MTSFVISTLLEGWLSLRKIVRKIKFYCALRTRHRRRQQSHLVQRRAAILVPITILYRCRMSQSKLFKRERRKLRTTQKLERKNNKDMDTCTIRHGGLSMRFHWNSNKVRCFLICRQFLWFHTLNTSMKFLWDFYFADLRFFEVGVWAEGRGSNPMFRKFWNFSGKMLVIRATADGVDDKTKKKKRKKRKEIKPTLIPKHQAKWAMPNQGLWCQSSVNRWWKLVDYIHLFFPAVSILSWNLLWELHLSVETVLRLNRRLLNPISHFPVPVCQEENPHPDQRAYKR